jgi:hypothetical protein
MVTKLHGLLKREVAIKGQAYVVALDNTGIKLTLKGRRLGQELKWEDFASGDAALSTALSASLARSNDSPRMTSKSKPARRRTVSKPKRSAK